MFDDHNDPYLIEISVEHIEMDSIPTIFSLSALTLSVGRQKGLPVCKKTAAAIRKRSPFGDLPQPMPERKLFRQKLKVIRVLSSHSRFGEK